MYAKADLEKRSSTNMIYFCAIQKVDSEIKSGKLEFFFAITLKNSIKHDLLIQRDGVLK